MSSSPPKCPPAGEERVLVRSAVGFPPTLDAIARRSPDGRGFLRAAWYKAAASRNARTLVATREDTTPIVAIPTEGIATGLVPGRSVPGSYWPFRSILITADTKPNELAAVLASPQARRLLAPAWRLGPVLRDDPATTMLEQAAADAGWTVLVRKLGRNYLLNLRELIRSGEWPRKSTVRRLANYERQLARTGEVEFRLVTGEAWNEAILEALAQIEANSWVGRTTDGSGAKFLSSGQRALWSRAIRDPGIANAVSATILIVGGTPVAFSFDLRAGTRQYSIASSYDERYAAMRPGKIVTYRQLQRAAAEGVEIVDLGAGDSGYKRELGALAGSEIIDLLIVRSRSISRILSLAWSPEWQLGETLFLSSANKLSLRNRVVKQLIAAGAVAGTAFAIAE